MPNKERSFHESPEKAGGEGWLYSELQQKLCHFKPDTATVHAQWVAIRAYSYVPPRPPEPMTRRRLLRHNAVEAWETMRIRSRNADSSSARGKTSDNQFEL